MTTDKSFVHWYFLFGVIILYFITLIVNSEIFFSAIFFFGNILINVIPVLILIFLLMVLTDFFVKPKILINYLGNDSGLKGWVIAVFSGILSSGPIYMWYPLLNDLQKKGMKPALIATFLYNRAIKIPLLPLLIGYFGVTYSFVLMFAMIFVSVIQGLVTEKILGVKK